MVTVISIILTVINLTAAILTTEVSSPQAKPQTIFAEMYYDYLTTTSAPYYSEGQTITFSLHDNSGAPLSASEWIIVDTDGEVVGHGTAASPDTPVFDYRGAWNQKNGNGEIVPAGVYTIIFPRTPNKSSAAFVILPGKDNRTGAAADYFRASAQEI